MGTEVVEVKAGSGHVATFTGGWGGVVRASLRFEKTRRNIEFSRILSSFRPNKQKKQAITNTNTNAKTKQKPDDKNTKTKREGGGG